MAYLEQSTRYIPYTERRGDSWRYLVPPELDGHPLRQEFIATMNLSFDTYARWIDPMRQWFERRYPKAENDSDAVYRSAIRAGARHAARACCQRDQSNVGICGTVRLTSRSCSACGRIRCRRCATQATGCRGTAQGDPAFCSGSISRSARPLECIPGGRAAGLSRSRRVSRRTPTEPREVTPRTSIRTASQGRGASVPGDRGVDVEPWASHDG